MSGQVRKNNEYDIIVIGAGHAGCEAALASARLGNATAVFVMDMESIAMMPCNPAIGGTGKGHLVREIDALGGEMGINIDKTFIQSRMLNTAKGPAVHSLRAQADKAWYHREMRKVLESQQNLHIIQEEVIDLMLNSEGKASGVITEGGESYSAQAVIIATGTFLQGKIFIGEKVIPSGPSGMAPSNKLAENLKKYGLELRRFKTGTPARALAETFDYTKMAEQKGDETITPFSFMNDSLDRDQVSCWLTYTNEHTHQVIRDNFHRSALFGGQIEGIGPRYCPSIEDKVQRFADKKRHQLFIEPEGLETEEMYIQGMSSSLPEDVQQEFYHTIEGLENITITKPAYAIEYDCINPLTLKQNLESRQIPGLFCAGQFNGSSGYEEAAAQGLMAGINAHLAISGKNPFVLGRNEAYIGVLIDDLVTKGTNEPYRIMTSRAEYRLLLRQDNADERLTEKAYELGLATEERYNKYLDKKEKVSKAVAELDSLVLNPDRANAILEKKGGSPISSGATATNLLKRPEITLKDLEELLEISDIIGSLNLHEKTQVETEIKYQGYINKQIAQVERFKQMENRRLPEDINYGELKGLRIEAAQKLEAIRPASLGQASRISGVSPADINVLLIHLERIKRSNNGNS